jgi:hypothetical protein
MYELSGRRRYPGAVRLNDGASTDTQVRGVFDAWLKDAIAVLGLGWYDLQNVPMLNDLP